VLQCALPRSWAMARSPDARLARASDRSVNKRDATGAMATTATPLYPLWKQREGVSELMKLRWPILCRLSSLVSRACKLAARTALRVMTC
jgi:hypothetical protein